MTRLSAASRTLSSALKTNTGSKRRGRRGASRQMAAKRKGVWPCWHQTNRLQPQNSNNRDGPYILIKGLCHQDDLTVNNLWAPNTGTLKYIQHPLADLKGEIDSNAIILADFNSPHTSVGRSPRQKVNKQTLALNETQ
uniref:Endonuclease/exonuclease/phosphatase domain-containing protein n=1 Tax=Equus caballus TaxID=9796 RepID=A0A9L0R508_HORSE